MIWLANFPLPPSVNDHLMPSGGRMVKTKKHRQYTDLCYLWAAQNRNAFDPIKMRLERALRVAEEMKEPFALRVDAFIVFHHDRVFTANNLLWAIDANNRLKPLLDGLVHVLKIDDKHFFAGNCEKVTTQSKDQECAILRIDFMKPRTLEQIRLQMKRESSTAVSSRSQ
jgi:hypothetical protein